MTSTLPPAALRLPLETVLCSACDGYGHDDDGCCEHCDGYGDLDACEECGEGIGLLDPGNREGQCCNCAYEEEQADERAAGAGVEVYDLGGES